MENQQTTEPMAHPDSGLDGQSTLGVVDDSRPKRLYPQGSDLWAIIGIFFIASIAAGGIVFVKDYLPRGIDSFLMYVISMGVPLVFALTQRALHKPSSERLLYWGIKSTHVPIILYGVALIWAISIVIEPLIELFPASMMEMLKRVIGTGFWAVAMAVVAAPLLEELLFRGVILQGIRERSGSFRAVLISSAIFGAIHIIPPQAINAFFVALVIGFIYLRTNSLMVVIIIHAINNAIAYVISTGEGADVSMREMIGNNTAYLIIYGFTLAVTIYLIIRIFRALRTMN